MSEITIISPGDTMIVGPAQSETAGESEVLPVAVSAVFPNGGQVRINRRKRNNSGLIEITVDHDQVVVVNGVSG